MLYQPAKIAAVSRVCLEKHLAVVVVGFPAVPLMAARTRLCISAAHSREDMDRALEVGTSERFESWIQERLANLMSLRHCRRLPLAQLKFPHQGISKTILYCPLLQAGDQSIGKELFAFSSLLCEDFSHPTQQSSS